MSIYSSQWLVLFCILIGLMGPAQAAEPDRAALRLLPPDTGIAFVVRDFRAQSQTVLASPFWKWFQQSAFGQQWLRHPDLAQLQQVDPTLKELLGTTLGELRDEIFGDLIAFAFQPANATQSSPEQALLLVRPRQMELLQKLITKLNQLQEQSGEVIRVRQKQHAGKPYFERVKREADGVIEADYYALQDGLLLFSSDEASVQAALARLAPENAVPDKNHLLLKEWDQFQDRLPAAMAWLNPRVFDQDLASRLLDTNLKADEKLFLRYFQRLWHGISGVVLSLHPAQNLELRLQIRFQEERLPPDLANLLGVRSEPLTVRVVPEQAFFAIQGQWDLPALLNGLGPFFLEPTDKVSDRLSEHLGPIIGKDRLTSVLQGIGPHWSFWLEAPTDPTESALPEWTLAVQVGRQKPAPELVRGLGQLLDYSAHLARVQYNRTHVSQLDLSEEIRGGKMVKVFTSETALPKGWRPAYGFQGAHLLIASRPERIWNFTTRPATGPAEPFLRLSPILLSQYLARNREPLAEQLAQWQDRPKSELSRELRSIETLLELAQSVELFHTAEPGRQELRLKLVLTKPLR